MTGAILRHTVLGRALFGLVSLRLKGDEPLLRQGRLATNPGDGLALSRDGRRKPCRSCMGSLAGAVEPVALRCEIDP